LPSIPFWFAPIGKGELFNHQFKAHLLFALFRRKPVRSEMALHEKRCSFGHRPLNGFSLFTPGLTSEQDGDVFYTIAEYDVP
jgi:hypothetical protein